MAGEYHSKDFEWEELREKVESDPSLSYHITPVDPLPFPCSRLPSSSLDSDAWRHFHRRHSTGRFFKERRYLLNEFPELIDCAGNRTVFEVGCGNGSTVLPILRARDDITVYACDCSVDAVELAKEMINAGDSISVSDRFHAFTLDFSVSEFPSWLFCSTCQSAPVPERIDFSGSAETPDARGSMPSSVEVSQCCIGGVDFVTLIFTLSALPFQKMNSVIMGCYSILKPGSLLFFRDYGLYDMTMLRFPPKQRVGFREYTRSDGTRSYFFSLDVVRDLFLNAGFIEIELEYCCVRTTNRHNGKSMSRVWVHGKFRKPTTNSTGAVELRC